MASGGKQPRDVSPQPPPTDAVRLHKSVSGTMKTDVGHSQFYSKVGIRPIHDTMDSLHHRDSATSNIKIKKMTRIYEGSTKFPKLEECAHFHYDFVELRPVQVEVELQIDGASTDSGDVEITDENQDSAHQTVDSTSPGGSTEGAQCYFYLRVVSDGKGWTIRRSLENFCSFDKQLHRCIYDRKYSLLPELGKNEVKEDGLPALRKLLSLYMQRFSSISGNMINCGPILSWLEMDNRGNRLMVTDDSAINTPAVAAAHVTKRYIAQASDELTFEVGDMISIIDMPRADETIWWRGKKGFQVGFFPCECVEIIADKIPHSVSSKIPETKPVLRKRGKLITFLRAFFTSRPARTTLKRTGIVKERVFGCDLGEHLLNSDHDVPVVLKCCAELIETEGIVDGIYRLSGVASNIQKLRADFDEEHEPNLTSDDYLQDIHSISSLLKMYFRELPNPLFTYQLYDKFASAVQDEDNKLMKIHDVVQQLPPPHYRTAEYLMKHLNRVSQDGHKTGMHCKNLAIVWAPNLLRSKDLESMCSTAALQGVGIQAIVTEFMIQYADLIFSDRLQNLAAGNQAAGPWRKSRPKSLAISTPTKLISLEEAREQILSNAPPYSPKQKFIEVGSGAAGLPKEFHTVIDLPKGKKSRKDRKSPVTGWRSIFTRSRASSWRSKSEDQGDSADGLPAVDISLPTNLRVLTEEDTARRHKLRTVRSADSLLSGSSSPHYKDLSGATLVNPYTDEFQTVRPKSASMERAKGTKRSRSYERSYSDAEVLDLDRSPSDDVFGFGDASGHSGKMDTSKQGFLTELEQRFSSYPEPEGHVSRSLPRSPTEYHGGAKPKLYSHPVPSERKSTNSLLGHGSSHVVHSPPHERSNSSAEMAVSPVSTTSSRRKSPTSLSSSEGQYLAGEAAASMSGISDDSFLSLPSQEMSPPPDIVPREKKSSPTHSGDSTKTRSASYVGKAPLSPIGEMLPVELTESPGTKRKLLARLSQNYTDLEFLGAEGAECEMASFDGHLTDDEMYRAHNISGTTDSESEIERREALSHPDLLNSSQEQPAVVRSQYGSSDHLLSQQHQAMSVGSLDGVTTEEGHAEVRRETETSLTRPHRSENELHVKGSRVTAVNSTTDLSKSLDSILQEATGSDVYNSEWEKQNGSNSMMTRSYDARFGSGEMTGFTSETQSSDATKCYTSTSSMDSDFHDRSRFDNLTHSPPAPPIPPPKKRQVREEHHHPIKSSARTPTNEEDGDAYGMPSQQPSQNTLQSLQVDTASSPEYFTTDLSPSVHFHPPERPTDFKSDFPPNILYPDSTNIELSESEIQYVHPRYLDAQYSGTSDDEDTLAHGESGEDSCEPGLEQSPSPPLPPPPGAYLSSDPLEYSSDNRSSQNSSACSDQRRSFSPAFSPFKEPITKGETGHIVIRRPAEGSVEGATHHAQISKVVPPKRQVAAVPPVPASRKKTPVDKGDADDVPVTEIREVSPQMTPVDVESPLDEKPCRSFVDKLTSGDGYMADRSSSASPTTVDLKGQGSAVSKLDASKFEMLDQIKERPSEKTSASELMFPMDDMPYTYPIKDVTTGSSEDIFISGSDVESTPTIPVPAPRRFEAGTPGDKESVFTVRAADGKPSPAKRKKSVRELMSKFEGSPPKSDDAMPLTGSLKRSRTPDLPSKPQGPMSLPTDRLYTDSYGTKSMEMEDTHSNNDPTALSQSHNDMPQELHSRRLHVKADIPVPTRSASPPRPKPRASRPPLSDQHDKLQQGRGVSPTKPTFEPTKQQPLMDSTEGPVLTNPPEPTSIHNNSDTDERVKSYSKGLHGDKRSSTTLSEKLKQFEELGASSDASSSGGTLERPGRVSLRKAPEVDSKVPVEIGNGSTSTPESELTRKMTERRHRVENIGDFKENKDPTISVLPVKDKSDLGSSKGSLKWKYGSKENQPEMEGSTRKNEVSTSEEEASSDFVQNRRIFDAQTVQAKHAKTAQSTNPSESIKGAQNEANVRELNSKHVSDAKPDKATENIPRKRETLSLAERRRQFENCGSLTRSSGSNRESSEREVCEPKERLSSVRDLQERFERQSVERDDRSSSASGGSHETSRSSSGSRSSVFVDPSFQTVEDDKSWNTIL